MVYCFVVIVVGFAVWNKIEVVDRYCMGSFGKSGVSSEIGWFNGKCIKQARLK